MKTRVLLLAAAGASVVSFGGCGPFTSGNLMAQPECGADGGPPNCYHPIVVDDGGQTDGGTDGGH